MKNMEERKAEIFRRSEKRIKSRKRRMVSVLCLPLLVGILFLSSGLYSDRFAKKSSVGGEVSNEGTLDSAKSATVSVAVKSDDDETSVMLDDEATVVEILNIIHEVTNINKDMAAGESDGMYYSQQSSQKIYTITVTEEDGHTTTYLLCEEKIIDTKNNREYEMSNEKLTTLKKLLCISEE